ncbi:two-partner secretion domain-containing protein [Psittacicella hinzii]|uniref:Filamentous haemagglutinin FhaB/tRNA nuclease CdiA-like TPS domain-containing protein n=1 Tax=Psittacicella hinzii TaxID=2028575 RepID=A0A3A1YLQ8_9GAMM|nr:filamentous hemagglutinin N-terminal domain-containing protein [Psittacicella hinzii]RIY39092.1 hypothetical protein CKF58_02860 [Psittacicella hinzii]
MNKIYKLVYSKTLNQVVAVSEIAKKAQPGSNKVEVSEADLIAAANGKGQLNKLAFTFVLGSLFSALPMGAASANTNTQNERVNLGEAATATANTDATATQALNLGVVADKGVNAPGVKYVNGVPVIDIVNPNKAGVSDNRFSKFSTNTGAVFNNLKNGSVAVDSAVLKQKLEANPNLMNEAKVILAQVTGNDKSVIKGALEVLGNRADLLVINPNGIDLNGVQLINVKDFTASTAEVNANNHLSQTVTRGELNVNGNLTSDDVDVIRLIAAAVKVKAQISPVTKGGKKANIVVAGGKQNFDLSTNTGTKLDDSEADAKVVISGDALGSMYGNKVNFVVSQSGAGVEYEGMVIGEDDLTITADGQIKVNNVYSKGNVELASANADVKVMDNGSVKALNKINIKAKSTVDTTKATLHASKAVEVSANDLVKVGEVQADQVKLTSAAHVLTEAATTVKANDVVITAAGMVAFQGDVVVGKNLAVKADTNKDSKTYNSQVTFNGNAQVGGVATISAAKIVFSGSDTAEQLAKNADDAHFKFDNLQLAVKAQDGAVTVKNTSLITNNAELTLSNANSDATDLIKTSNAKVRATQTTTVDFVDADINAAKNLSQVKNVANTFDATLTKVKAGNITIGEDDVVNLDRAYTFYTTKDFNNSGVLATENSLSVQAKGAYNDYGLTLVKGNYVVDAEGGANLDGKLYTTGNFDLRAPEITQEGSVSVGGDFTVKANKYDISSVVTGNLAVSQGAEETAENWHYHAARKDRYTFTTTIGTVDASSLEFATAETNVSGNFTLTGYDEATASKLIIDNSRFYAEGDVNVKGDVTVRSSTYTVNVADLLSYKSQVSFEFVPISLINTYLTRANTIKFDSLYDFFNKLADGSIAKTGRVGYQIRPEQILNLLKSASFASDERMNKVLAAVLGTDWKGIDYNTFKTRWNTFEKNKDNYKIAVFAPTSELFTAGNYTQTDGSLYVGSDLEKIEKVDAANLGGKYGTFVKVESGEDVLIASKISGLRTNERYYKLLGKLITLDQENNTYTTSQYAPSWLQSTKDLTSILTSLNVIAEGQAVVGDNGVISLLLLEQYKDLVGGYLTVGRSTDEIITKFLQDTEARKKALESLTYVGAGSYTMVIDDNGTKQTFKSRSDAYQYLEDNYDYITFETNESGKGTPRLHVSTVTKAAATNFDQVAASLSAVKSINANVDKVTVKDGSLNTKVLTLTAKGDIDLTGVAGQNALNADKTTIKTEGDFNSIGNLRVGDFSLEAVGDANFSAVAFFTDDGYLNHQGLIKADEVSIKADNLTLDAADIKAQDEVNIDVEGDIKLKATHNVASDFVSEVDTDASSARQISQSAAFVDGSEISGENVNIKAGGDVKLESSAVKAQESATIEAENIETSAKADVKTVQGKEYKTNLIGTGSASFGSQEATGTIYLLASKNINGDEDERQTVHATSHGSATSGASARGSFGFSTELTQIEVDTVTHKNNELNAKNLTIKVADQAELGNTNINNNGTITAEDIEKTSTIEATTVTQINQKDIIDLKTSREKFTLGVSLSAQSSILDAVSHVVSAARANKMGMEVDASYAATVVGDLSGIVNRDATAATTSVKLSYERDTAAQVAQADSTNTFAGTVNINTTGDTQLKAVNGVMKDLNINADNVTIEGATSDTTSAFTNKRFGLSIDLNAGANKNKGDVTASATFAFSTVAGTTDASKVRNAQIHTENININAANDVDLHNVNMDAAKDININAKNIKITTDQDTIKSRSSGGGFQVTAGLSVVSLVPFASVGINFETHKQETAMTAQASGLASGNELNINADNLNLKSAVLVSNNSGEVNVDNIQVENNKDHNYVTGGQVGLSVGASLSGAVVVSLTGGKDRSTYYEQEVQSTISDNIKVNENTTGLENVNRNLDEVVKVKKNVTTQETGFNFTVTSGNINDLKSIKASLSDAIANIKGAISGTSSRNTLNEVVQTYVDSDYNYQYDTLSGSAYTSSSNLNCNCNYDISTLLSNSGSSSSSSSSSDLSSYFVSASSGSTFIPGLSNSYQTKYNTGYNKYGSGENAMYDITKQKYYYSYDYGKQTSNTEAADNSLLAKMKRGDFVLTQNVFGGSTQLVQSFQAESASGSAGVRYFKNNVEEVDTGDIRDVRFGEFKKAKPETNTSTETTLASDNSGSVNTGSTVITDNPNIPETTTPVITTPSVDLNTGSNTGTTVTDIGKQVNEEVTKAIDEAIKTNINVNTGVVGGNGQGTNVGGGTGTGTGIGFGAGEGTGNGTNAGSYNGGNTSSSSTGVNIGGSNNSGSYSSGSNAGNNNPNSSGNDFDLDFGGDQSNGQSGTGTSTTSDNTNVTFDSSSSSNADNNTSTSGSASSSDSNQGSQGGDSSSANNDSSNSGSSATNDSDNSATTDVSVGKDREASAANEAGLTPADGNAQEGDVIRVGENTTVVKYQLGNLSCYVLSSNGAGAAHTGKELVKGTTGAGVESLATNGMVNAAKPRATLFSTYSKGIEDAIGDNGVICIPTTAEVLKTDYNVVTASTVIPIVKTASKPLQAVVVTEQKLVKVNLAANSAKATKAAKPVPVTASVREIKAIQSTLQAKGIDANKVMILGVKGGVSADGIAQMIKQTVNTSVNTASVEVPANQANTKNAKSN